MQGVRIYDMPDCRMVSSGIGNFGEPKFERFIKWMSAQKRELHPRDFLFFDGGGMHWVYTYEDGMTVPEEFEIIDFPGGLYAVATDIDQATDVSALTQGIDDFIGKYGFERDDSRPGLGNIITSHRVRDILGYEQMEYYFPIRAK